MKKILFTIVLFFVTFILSSCSQLPTLERFSDAVLSYKDKLDEIIISKDIDELINNDQQAMMLSTTPKADILNLYQNYQTNFFTVSLDPMLLIYQDLLNQIIIKIQEEEIESLDAILQIEFIDQLLLDATINIDNKNLVIIRLSLSREETILYQENIKMGYVDDNFTISDIYGYTDDLSNQYDYFEFVENDYMINMRSGDMFWYKYQNEKTKSYYEIANVFEPLEGQEEFNLYGNKAYTVTWFDQSINLETMLMVVNDEVINSHYRIFNDHGVVMEMTFIGNSNLEIRYELLEATGWDSYGLVENGYEIYLNDTQVFSEATISLVENGDMYAFLFGKINILPVAFTEEVYNLTRYDLFLDIDLSYDEFMNEKENTYTNYQDFATFNDINFLDENSFINFYNLLDSDIK